MEGITYISNLEYFILGMKEGLGKDLNWYFETMTLKVPTVDITSVPAENKVYVYDNIYYVKDAKGNTFRIRDINPKERPIFLTSDKIRVDSNTIINIKEPVETTIGRAILNYVLLANNFGTKVEYINNKISTEGIESILADYLGKDIITVTEYNNFVNSASFLENFSKIITITATYKNLVGPEGLEEFKIKTAKEFDNLYGPEWRKDKIKVGLYVDKLKEFDKEYLKDDPALNKVLTKKIQTNARAKMYLAFGFEGGMNSKDEFVNESLADGYPKDNKKLASIIDASRSGSYNRGHQTQDGGVVGKYMQRISTELEIKPGDCGSKLYFPITVIKENADNLVGLYYKEGNSVKLLDNPHAMIGKTIEVRTPIFCKYPKGTYCGTCCGKNLENKKTGLNLVLMNIGANILKASLKKMHNSQIVTGRFGIMDFIK